MRTPGGIARHFDARHPVVLNLEGVTKDAALRLVDFLGGVAYAKGGELVRIAKTRFCWFRIRRRWRAPCWMNGTRLGNTELLPGHRRPGSGKRPVSAAFCVDRMANQPFSGCWKISDIHLPPLMLF